jgi:mono/diheme cytochrome c family protein
LDFHRSRPAVAHYVQQHFPQHVAPQPPGPKPRRRWQCAHIGQLWQHDSSPHPWWPTDTYPTLILTADDHSRKIVAGTFVPSDPTWSHFRHLRSPIEKHGPPATLYTDGLSLFGHRSTADRLDTHSQFQRAFTALGVAHRVAPDAQAKGKIERRFDTFQKRLVTLLAYERITDFKAANQLLQTQLDWHNQHHVCRTTGLTPNAAWDKALAEKRSRLLPVPPPPLLDLHLAIYHQRRLNADGTLDFLGRTGPSPPCAKRPSPLFTIQTSAFGSSPKPPIPNIPSGPPSWLTTASEKSQSAFAATSFPLLSFRRHSVPLFLFRPTGTLLSCLQPMKPEPVPATDRRVDVSPGEHRTALVTLVFTDIVGSTQLKQDLGDRQAVALIQRHHATVRELLAGFVGAREISTAGDSFFLVFDKPSDDIAAGRWRRLRFAATNCLDRPDFSFVFSGRSGHRIGRMKSSLPKLLLPLLMFGLALANAEAQETKPLPPAATRTVRFTEDIKPLIEASCIKCHAHGQKKGSFRLDTRELLLKGGESGPAVVVGRSAESYLVKLVAGLDPDKVMPAKGPKLTADQIGLVRAWIDQGLEWPEGLAFRRAPQAPLFPRRPEIPVARARSGSANPIDRWLEPYFAKHNFTPPPPVSDRIFARRVYLDVIGLLPSPEDLEAFLKDKRTDKRARLVQKLLADNQRYAEHWLTFWNDALRNDYRGTGYIDGGRKQISEWLFRSLAQNVPYDQFVSQLINPTEESAGFSKGIVWRGVVNASQVPPMQAAQNISQVFLGINLKCASCHDSFINDWKLADSYGLANIYADEPLEVARCDSPTGEMAQTKFLFPELGDIDAKLAKPERLKRLAEIITSRQDGRLTRTIVNRLWAKLMGRGLIEPVDQMDDPPWHADLLDWLACDLADSRYDLKRTLELILTSDAYQLPAVGLPEQAKEEFVFRGPVVRRLSAEQFLDALGALTGVWHKQPAGEIDFNDAALAHSLPAKAGDKAAKKAPRFPAKAKWIWHQPGAEKSAAPGTIYLRKTIKLAEVPAEARVVASCDNSFTLYVNGKEVTKGTEWEKPRLTDIRTHLVKGENVIAVAATNGKGSDDKPADNPAGFLCYVFLREAPPAKGSRAAQILDFASDGSWGCTTNKLDGWEKPDFKSKRWARAAELGDVGLAPWNLTKKFARTLSHAEQYEKVRASLVNNDPLMTALGRPNREQVITSRATVATTLQALEMTNGATLARLLQLGAENLLSTQARASRGVIERLFLQALGRQPTAEELELAQELVGQPAQKEGVEDFLWAMTMLPEFQLIY